jgi:glutathione reductase (NADPH)
VPSVTFTISPIAMVGQSEGEARKRGLKYRIKSQKPSDWRITRRVAEPVYGFKTLVEENTDRVPGAHLVGTACGQVHQYIRFGDPKKMTAEGPKAAIFADPTGASDISDML